MKTSRKVSDMNKDFVINFLQEYSHYIRNFKKMGHHAANAFERLQCPTEFFQSSYLAILKETEQIEDAFNKDLKLLNKEN